MHFLTRLWGQEPSLTFAGHEWNVPFEVDKSFEDIATRRCAVRRDHRAVRHGLRPAALHRGRHKLPPATEFLQRAFAEPGVLKGIICHGMWLVAPAPELVRGRPVVVHNNLHGDAEEHGRDLHRRGRGRGRRPRHRAHRRPLPPVRAQDHRAARRATGDSAWRYAQFTTSASPAATRSRSSASTPSTSASGGRGSSRSGDGQIVFIENGRRLPGAVPGRGRAAGRRAGERRRPGLPGLAATSPSWSTTWTPSSPRWATTRGHARPARLRRLHPGHGGGLDRRPGRQHRRAQPGLRTEPGWSPRAAAGSARSAVA